MSVNILKNNNNIETNRRVVDQVEFVISCSKKDTNIDNNNISKTIEITVNNVVSSYSTKCHLNLRRIAMEGMHVEFKKENNMINMKLRNPLTTATMWSSGKITCAGAKSETESYKAARRYCRLLQKLGYKVKLCNYRIVNVLATCSLPFEIDISRLSNNNPKNCSYEPELHPGATYKIRELKATLKIFTTGSITLTAPSVDNIQKALTQIYPTLIEYKRIVEYQQKIPQQQIYQQQQQQPQQQITQTSNIHLQQQFQQNYHNHHHHQQQQQQQQQRNYNNNIYNNHNNNNNNTQSMTTTTTTTKIYPTNNNNNNNTNTTNTNQYYNYFNNNHYHYPNTAITNYSMNSNLICTLNANQTTPNSNKLRPCLISDEIDDEFLP